MQLVRLREYEKTDPLALTGEQLSTLQKVVPRLVIEPALNDPGSYVLTAGSYVGVIRIPHLQIDIYPKIAIDRLFFILSYGTDPALWQPDEVLFSKDDTVLEAVAPLYCRVVATATRRGLLHGYHANEDALMTLRGQVRFSDQLRIHHGVVLPVEVRYDEYTEDIYENQVLLAALRVLSRLPLRSADVQRGLREIAAAFQEVRSVPIDIERVRQIQFTRLDRHYETAIRLAAMILRSGSLDMGSHEVTASGFLIDMNELFELFVHRALREALQLSDREFPRGNNRLRLDEGSKIKLVPDLSWWQDDTCRFVGDVKYKRVNAPGIEHPDIYQLLAYTIAAGLHFGLLIYAKGESDNASHLVRHANKTLRVECLDLTKNPSEILHRIKSLAFEISRMAILHSRF